VTGAHSYPGATGPMPGTETGRLGVKRQSSMDAATAGLLAESAPG
jgi:hypothetical protein